ncbi:MAG: glycerol-3-phosphate acyltransferase [Ilumatobacteraceae bacterium]
MRAAFRIIVPAAAGYLLGSIPVADLVSRRRDVDLRDVGDHNPGYWNARESLGDDARLVLAGDMGKGALAALIGRSVAGPGEWWVAVVGVGAAMVGHAWPVFARFRGGRAVATFGGGAIALSPVSAGVALGFGAAAGRTTSSSATGIRIAVGAFPVVQLLLDGPRRTAATGLLMTFVGLRFLTAARAEPS